MDKILLPGFALLAGMTYFHLAGQPTAIENAPKAVAQGSTLVYFGARDCPACRSFSSGSGYREMEAFARSNRMKFVSYENASLRDLGRDNVYSDFTPVWRATKSRTGQNAVPSFALVTDGGIVAASVGEWQSVARKAKQGS